MNIIIAGCGKVGSTLAEQLSREGHDITLIDQKTDVVRHMADEPVIIFRKKQELMKRIC